MPEVRWTPQQAAAITETGHALLVANAGTGKTETVVAKIRWLLGLALQPARDASDPEASHVLTPCDDPCDLREIAAITFTEKAAYDLKRKLRDAITSSERADELRWQIDRASIGTIHSFCGELLREHALRLEIDPTFRLLNEREAWAAMDDLIVGVVKTALEEGDPGAGDLLQTFKLTGATFSDGVVDYVRRAMADLRWHAERYAGWTGPDGKLDIATLERLAGDWEEDKDGPALRHAGTLVDLARRALTEWNAYLAEENARDFDAIILDARALLTGPNAAAALAGIQRRYRILIIDEFQDTDGAQWDIARAIAGLLPGSEAGPGAPGRPQLFLVGDPKQSIYRFRGADVSVWNQVTEAIGTHGKVLELSENFRCAPPIVRFVNDVCGQAMMVVGDEIVEQDLSSRIEYTDLVAGIGETETAGLEWLVAQKEQRNGFAPDTAGEAAHVAMRIAEMIAGEQVIDPETGEPTAIKPRHIAILYRSRGVLEQFEATLSKSQIPYYISGAPHLGDRQEILDLLNLLRLLRNPRDDYRAFGFLRSPFVALRDEVIAEIGLHGKGPSLLVKARRFLSDGEWFDGPEGELLSDIECAALARALTVLAEARDLVHRVPLDEVLQFALDALGYRLHLLVRGEAEEQLANIQSFLQFTEQYRDLDIATFLEVWERWDAQDNGLPQAPLYSKNDDVVTLSTIHAAKGLEWPVVFFVGTGPAHSDRSTNAFWSDPEFGPVLCPRKDDRGKRTWRLHRRNDAEEIAEDTRLLYVATTRARDRLVIVGPENREKSYSAWLAAGVEGNGFSIRDTPPELVAVAAPLRPTLGWLGELDFGSPPPLLREVEPPQPRFVVSATELMGRAKDEQTWRLRYSHGVQPKWEFARQMEEGTLEPDAASAAPSDESERPVPATVRGTVIHDVLEHIREEAELSRLLRVAIGGLDDPDLEEALEADEYRMKLEEEICRVVRSEEWAWYVGGEHYRELEFVHLAGSREWRVGAFDLYRPGPPAWVIDFKTHEIEADEAERVSKDYAIQARIYREASAVRGNAAIALHFTGPNSFIEMD